jgi:polyhydroxybutyrate depolymerase
VGDGQRSYRLYVPTTAGSGAVLPLVVMLHGGFGSGEQAEQAYGWDEVAEREGFLVAYPDGLNRAWNVGGGCCGTPGRTGVDDVGFVVDVVEDIAAQLPVDRDRVFATGISNGGMLAYRLACDTSVFAAVGPDAATLLGACPDPAPISVLHIHGTADESIRLDGGPGGGVAKIDGPPVAQVIATWRELDRCDPATVTTQGQLTWSVAECADSRTVTLVTVDGAGHQWPGADFSAGQRLLGLDPPSTALSATEAYWEFFAAHPRPGSA